MPRCAQGERQPLKGCIGAYRQTTHGVSRLEAAFATSECRSTSVALARLFTRAALRLRRKLLPRLLAGSYCSFFCSFSNTDFVSVRPSIDSLLSCSTEQLLIKRSMALDCSNPLSCCTISCKQALASLEMPCSFL